MKLVVSLLLSLMVVSEAVAACYLLGPGVIWINRRTGIVRGGNWQTRAVCTRNVPPVVRVSGGRLCDRGSIYGWNANGQPWRCTLGLIRK